MAGGKSTQVAHDWRSEPESPRRVGPPVPVWRKEPLKRRRRWRKTQVGLLWLGLVFLATMLAWASTWLRPPKPACLVLIGADYCENLAVPHNGYGWQGLEDLAALVRDEKWFSFWGANLLDLKRRPVVLRSDTPWDNNLGDFEEKTLVLFMALHGGADAQGAYLLPDDAGPENTPESRLRLAAVLDRLADLPEDKNKVLILDATQLTADWQLGLLHNDFARELDRLNDRIAAIPNLVVLSASDVDQRSWVCPPQRRTIFAHALIEGLRGAAADVASDGRIDVWDLHCFARDHVERWVRANRGALQTPVLLPQGDVGQQRARQIDLGPIHNEYRPGPAPSPALAAPPQELAEVWKRHQALSQLVPPPSVYTPHRWRRYQDTLLRYEELLLAGEAEAADRLHGRLGALERDIRRTRYLPLGSRQNGLAMAAAVGIGGPPQPDGSRRALDADRKIALGVLNQLWGADPAQQGKLWSKLENAAGEKPAERMLLRLDLCELILDRATEDPAQNLAKANQVLHVTADPLHPWPAEAHYLVMLCRDLPSGVKDPQLFELVRLALRVRRLAEQTALAEQLGIHPYSEQVYRWTADQVAQADQQRRLGEDLLFADARDWLRARAYLEKAQQQYRGIHDGASKIAAGLAVRDRALATLPYYSRWVARRMSSAGGRYREAKAMVDEVEALWRETHCLVEALEPIQSRMDFQSVNKDAGRTDFQSVCDADGLKIRPTDASRPLPGPSALRNVADQVEIVRQGLDGLEDALKRRWTKAVDVDSPNSWREAGDALTVPLADPELRMKLVAASLRGAGQPALAAADGEPRLPPISASAQQAGAQAAARAQGRMALAVLGPWWFDRCVQGGHETYDQVRHRLNVFQVEQDWWKSIRAAGDQVGRCFDEMAPTVAHLVDDSRRVNRAKALESLCLADRLSRQISGAVKPKTGRGPADLYRRLLTQGLLLWQAERSFQDHWYAEDPEAEPYYRVVGLSYLNDAESLDAHTAAVDALRRKLIAPGNLVVVAPPAVHMTTEPDLRVDYTLKPDKGASVPAGIPTTWFTPGKSLALADPAAGRRLAGQLESKQMTDPVRCTISSPLIQKAEAQSPDLPAVEKTSLELTALFRGQRITTTTPVQLYLLPDAAVGRFPRPDRASVAVRAPPGLQRQYGEGSGAVAIVLDCTGSMGPPEGKPFTKSTKFAEATQALRDVLRDLPQGTTVSLWVFGQAMGADKTVKEAEKTIRRVQDPIPWDPSNTEQLEQLMAKVEHPALEPWNESPIVRAMLSAKEDLDGAAGFKTLMVITDGMDNRFADDAQANPKKKDIPTVLRETFEHSGITVNVVGFKVVGKEESQARKQFEVVEKLFPPGKFFTVSETEALAATLDTALRQRLRYWVEHYDHTPVAGMPPDGLDVSQTGANDQWFPGGLPPRAYTVRVNAGRPLSRDIALDCGDLLLLRLNSTPQGPLLERAVFAEEDYPWKPYVEQAGWRLTLLQNQLTEGHGLTMLLALEKKADPKEAWLQQIKPRELWIELSTPKGTAPSRTDFQSVNCGAGVPPAQCSRDGRTTIVLPTVATRCFEAPGYPGPAWSIEAPQWPTLGDSKQPARPVLRAWWNPDQPTPADASLDRGHDFRSLAELAGKRLDVAGGDVAVESVTVEEHVVPTGQGKREKRLCLVIRLGHGVNKPVWARVEGPQAAGCEHRFYHAVGKSTSLFWPVTRDEAETALERLSLVSVESFKQTARRRGFTAELGELSAPDAADTGPRPLTP